MYKNQILKMCYDNFVKTGDYDFELIAHNGNELVLFDNIVDFLEEDDLIEIIAETAFSFQIQITPKGIASAKALP